MISTPRLVLRPVGVDVARAVLAGAGPAAARGWPGPEALQVFRFALEHDWNVGGAFIDEVKWQVSYSPQARDMRSFQTREYPGRVE